MGTACSVVLSEKPTNSIRLWVRNPVFASHIAETRENTRLLPGVRVPQCVNVTSDSHQALENADVVLVCVPTRAIRDSLNSLLEHIPTSALMVSAAKGIELKTLLRPSEIISELPGSRSVVALGGPCHAEEAAVGKPATVVAASNDAAAAELVQRAFSNRHFRVYSSTDLRGVELAGALKNVIAIAAGIGDGLDFGDNARSALITRGLAEMVRFGTAMGVSAQTFYGLAGIGDLVATCGSRHSRNRRVGELLGRGSTLVEIQSSMQAVAEGVYTAKSICAIASRQNLDMPIANAVHEVLFEGKSPGQATEELMQRPLKQE
jgi:glycerol-3-phosphate dehydrogenase (NAD(P)+)